MENIKHVALRTCIATGEKKDKREMIRLVKSIDGKVLVDIKGKVKGRGANISMNLDAFDLAVKKKAIERALKLEKKLSVEEIQNIRNLFETALKEKELRKGNKMVSVKISKSEFDKITDK